MRGRAHATDASLHAARRRRSHLTTGVVPPRTVCAVIRPSSQAPDRLLTTPGIHRRKKSQESAPKGRVSLTTGAWYVFGSAED